MIRSIFLILFLICQLSIGLISQLTDSNFPDRYPSSRTLTNNKRLFKAYKGQKMVITLVSRNVRSADFFINGRKVPVNFKLITKIFGADIKIDITSYLKDGTNTFSLQNISPKGSTILAYVPYPTLRYDTPESVGISSKLLNKVDELINAEIKDGFPGATLVIVKNGAIVKETAYGYARKYTDEGKFMKEFEKMKIDTMFDVASNTKMFATIFSLMKLSSDKVLKYTDPIHKYIPEYAGKDRKGHDREKINVFDILTHTAGYQPTYQFYDNNHIEFYSRDKSTTKKLLCTKVDIEKEKGGLPIYSDLDYILAGLLVESISKLELQDFVKQFIYNPLGLKRTTFIPLKKGFNKKDAAATEVFGNTRNHTIDFKDIRKVVVQGEVQDETSFYSMNATSGHAGLFSTAKEMAIMCQVLLNHGGYGDAKFWTKDTQDLFVKPYDKDLTYGVGWRRAGNEGLNWHFGAYGSNEAIGHTGWTGTVTVIDPKHDLSIVLLTNKKHSSCIKGKFEGDKYQTGQYGSIVQLIYESFLHA